MLRLPGGEKKKSHKEKEKENISIKALGVEEEKALSDLQMFLTELFLCIAWTGAAARHRIQIIIRATSKELQPP